MDKIAIGAPVNVPVDTAVSVAVNTSVNVFVWHTMVSTDDITVATLKTPRYP
jgi:hypothetical protein